MTIRILVVDDEEMIRTGFRMILEAESDLQVVGEAVNGAEAVKLTSRLRPDVVLMDIHMPVMDGLEATRQIAAMVEGVNSQVLILTTFEEKEYVFRGLQAGASGFLLKRSPAAMLVEGVRVVAAGEALLSPSVTTQLIQQFTGRSGAHGSTGKATLPQGLDQLTKRESEVLTLLARGLSNAEIAAELVISEGTVKTHVKRVYAKLTLRDRAQAVIYAYNVGLVKPGMP
jgi:DNA-binding NarL/FixJ family response regulator